MDETAETPIESPHPSGAGAVKKVGRLIRTAAPFVYCPACIACKLTMAESSVRRALKLLVSLGPNGHPSPEGHPEFGVAEPRTCDSCAAVGKTVMALR
jgi:hypothetical protein